MITSDSSFYWKRVTIPKGLPALLEILAKETIRENPKDIAQFLSTLVDDLIAKRDQEKGGSSREKDNLLKKGNRKNSYTFTDEELAASKIQAGFRGYKTRKSLKSKKRKAGNNLSLTSLTPLVPNKTQDDQNGADASEEDVSERKRIEKEVDEAIAAEIKTPLETIREESIDGSFRVKTPDVKYTPVDVVDSSLTKKTPTPPKPKDKDMADEILEELSEELHQINLLEIHENLSEELELVDNNNLSLDDAKTESMELEVELEQNPEDRESDTDRELMEKHVIEVLNEQELGEDDPTFTSQSLGTTDVKGASLEIHESEVETMLLEEDSVANADVEDGESEQQKIVENPPTKTAELLENLEDCIEIVEKGMTTELEGSNSDFLVMDATDSKSEVTLEQSAEKVISVEGNPPTDLSDDMSDSILQNQPHVESSSQSEQVKETGTPVEDKSKDLTTENTESSGENQVIGKSDEMDEIEFIDDYTDNEKVVNNLDSQDETKQPDTNLKLHRDSIVDVEMPSLFLSHGSKFSNTTDSASISSSTTTVRPLAFHKHEDSSQDASSLSESPVVPRPKPRKPISVSFEENKSPAEEPATVARNLSSELMEESESPLPVMRRQKSSPKTRGRAVASKYRSGIVMDEEVSMEEMEAQIENDMLSQAATKIQAGFRGYKTRKSMGVSGSGKKRAKMMPGCKDENALNSNAADPAAFVAPTPMTPPTPDSVASTEFAASETGFAPASSSSDSLGHYITDQDKPLARPTLAYLRSRSYPGSHEKEEDVKGGHARGRGTKTTSADGAAAAIAADALDDPTGVSTSTPELEYDPAYVNTAAIKIQAQVRGFLVRKHSKRGDTRNKGQITEDTPQTNNQGEIPRVQFDVGDLEHGDEAFIEFNPELPPTPHGAVELIINPAEERAWRDSASPISDVGSDVAATKIQAAFRGFKDRQKVRHAKKAVVTIQATVRGFLTRRRLMKLRRRSLQSRRRSSAKSMMMSPEVQKMKKANDAATKIQSVYRGYQVRSKIRKVGSDDEQN